MGIRIYTQIHTPHLTRHKLERIPTVGDVCMIGQRLRERERLCHRSGSGHRISRKPCSPHPCKSRAIGMLGTCACSLLVVFPMLVGKIIHNFQRLKPFSTQLLVSLLYQWKNACPLPFGLGFEPLVALPVQVP